MALHEFPFAVPYLEEAGTLQFRRLVRYRDALYPGCRVPNVQVLGEMRDLLVRRVSVRGHADHFRCLDEFVCARCRPYRRGSRGSFLLMSGVEMTPEDFVEVVLRFLRRARELPRDRLAFGELRQGRLLDRLQQWLDQFDGGLDLRVSATLFAHHPLFVRVVALEDCDGFGHAFGRGQPLSSAPREHYSHAALWMQRLSLRHLELLDAADPSSLELSAVAGNMRNLAVDALSIVRDLEAWGEFDLRDRVRLHWPPSPPVVLVDAFSQCDPPDAEHSGPALYNRRQTRRGRAAQWQFYDALLPSSGTPCCAGAAMTYAPVLVPMEQVLACQSLGGVTIGPVPVEQVPAFQALGGVTIGPVPAPASCWLPSVAAVEPVGLSSSVGVPLERPGSGVLGPPGLFREVSLGASGSCGPPPDAAVESVGLSSSVGVPIDRAGSCVRAPPGLHREDSPAASSSPDFEDSFSLGIWSWSSDGSHWQ